MAIVSKFLASKWVTVALILALAGGTYYVYSQGKMLGGATEKLEAYEVTIDRLGAANDRLAKEIQSKQDALTSQEQRVAQLRRNARLQQLAVQEARKNADKALKECLDMHIAHGMRFGPSRENGSGESEAGSAVDG